MSASKLDPESPEAKARAARSAIACVAAGLTLTAFASAEDPARANTVAADSVRTIFANHDCCGRLANTKIVEVGVLRSGAHRLTIYDLWFVNPESRHGMRRVAIVEGRRFRGSYIINSSLIPIVAKDRVRFTCEPPDEGECGPSSGEDLVIDNGVLPPRLWAGWETHDREDSI